MMELRQLLTHDPVGGWDKAWQASTTPWDLGGVTPAVAALVAAQEGSPLHLPPSIRRVLVPAGYDVEVLASDGREATALTSRLPLWCMLRREARSTLSTLSSPAHPPPVCCSPAIGGGDKQGGHGVLVWQLFHYRPPQPTTAFHAAPSSTPYPSSAALLAPVVCLASQTLRHLAHMPIAPAMPSHPHAPAHHPSMSPTHHPSMSPMHRPSMSLHGSHRVQVLLCAGAIAEGQDSRAARITLMFPVRTIAPSHHAYPCTPVTQCSCVSSCYCTHECTLACSLGQTLITAVCSRRTAGPAGLCVCPSLRAPGLQIDGHEGGPPYAVSKDRCAPPLPASSLAPLRLSSLSTLPYSLPFSLVLPVPLVPPCPPCSACACHLFILCQCASGHRSPGHGAPRHGAPRHGAPGARGTKAWAPGHGAPGMGHQGTGHQGMGHQGTGHQGMGHQGTGHQGMGHQGTRSP
ncbi:unnamed protein product, partial [Closterium sp. NIES-64]